ncbi:KAP family NTPase [Sphingobium sp. PNB]|uniref:P-loop NTPase fold protein n=1 Tax=Sphingobium sp. PNB TaxID=863934 RepID=UPI001CA4373C|nr:P-loop NTPase fold protein [Sphingobium sp. PNB]MCB4862479.1 KAP family NTPase [Sphingobium sp. PNB]
MQTNPNAHILSYIAQYLSKEPTFALMISGEWGAGKTFLVRSVFQGRSDILYVSLNGTAKTSEVIERLYLAAYPVFADKTMRALGSIARTVGGVFRLKSDLKFEDLFDLDRYKILVLDDIERSLLSPQEILGFINNFVEHDSKHVILIANENELENKPNYKQIREKVVGSL